MRTWISRSIFAIATLSFNQVSAQAVRTGERSGNEVVDAVCSECHAAGAKGAPRIGERADWSKRLSQGIDSLARVAIRGHDGMPARGGKAELTDNEIRNAIIYMFNPVPAAKPGTAGPAATPAAKPGGNVRVVHGTEIYLGLLPAEVLRSFPKTSAERSMHGGIPSGSGYYHVNVSVLDSTKAPVPGASVEVKVDERGGFSSETKTLEPITFNNVPSYGGYVRLKGKTQYQLTVKVKTPASPQPLEARFDHQLY